MIAPIFFTAWWLIGYGASLWGYRTFQRYYPGLPDSPFRAFYLIMACFGPLNWAGVWMMRRRP